MEIVDFVVVWMKPSHRLTLARMSSVCGARCFLWVLLSPVSCGQGWDPGWRCTNNGGAAGVRGAACWGQSCPTCPAKPRLALSSSLEAKNKRDIANHGDGLWCRWSELASC